jgi:crotonobetaine/carnitine-CoA ligase
MRAFVDAACGARGDAPFLMFRGRTWSYADTGAVTDAIAAELVALGIVPGDRLAMQLPTGPEHVFLWLATAKAGIVSCPLHPDLAPPEVEAALRVLSPRGWIDSSGSVAIGGAAVARIAELLESRRALTGLGAPSLEAIATILTTSGTTGRPKAAMLSHRMAVLTGEGFAYWLRLGATDRLFTCLPLSHINARFYSTLGAVAAGASLALEARFSASRFWSFVRDAGATEVNAIGAMLKILLDAPPSGDDRRHALRLVYAAPALGREAHLAFERRFGTKLVIGYGLTESTFGFIQPLDGPCDVDAMGLPRRHPDPALAAEVRLVDGEIWLRNPATFSGYLGDDEATRETLTEDGWLKTGDLATVGPDGSYTFRGRKKLAIRRRGEMLTPGEVEAALESHPSVLEAAVVGVPSPLGEDDVMAHVVLRPGMQATETELAAHCAQRLAPFKIPTHWRFSDRLPRTPTQRIAYHLLDRGQSPFS